MCFKKLRRLKNLCNFTPEDFEYKPSYSSQMFKMRTDFPDEEIKSNELKNLLTWIDDGETAVSSGTSLIDEISPPSDLPEHILAKLTGDIDKDLEMIKEWKK